MGAGVVVQIVGAAPAAAPAPAPAAVWYRPHSLPFVQTEGEGAAVVVILAEQKGSTSVHFTSRCLWRHRDFVTC